MLIYTFVAVQLVLMVMCLLQYITPTTFYITINSFTGTIMVGLNINQIALYFKQSGQPYKSQKHFAHVKHVGIVCAVWTVAYAVKVVAVYEGQYLF